MDEIKKTISSDRLKIYLTLIGVLIILFGFRINQQGGIISLQQQSANESFSTDTNDQWSQWRSLLADKISARLPGDEGAILSGILIGEKSNLSVSLNRALKNTSTIHIVVVSGQNLSMIAGFVMLLASKLGRKRTIILTSLIVIFYALLTGFQIPVIRALIMVLFAFLAQVTGRERDGVRILFLTAIIMLLYNPSWAFSISFQLSFLATFAVLVVSPLITPKLIFLPDLIKQDVGVALSAQALTWPVIAYNFHQVSLIGVIVNVLVLWTVPLIMILGGGLLIFGLISSSLGSLMAIFLGVLLNYFIDVVTLGNSISFSNIQVGNISLIVFAGYYLILIGLLWSVKKSQVIVSDS